MLAAQPDHVDALRHLADLYQQTNRTADLIATVRRLVALRPTDAIWHFRLGTLLSQAGDADGAIDALQTALTCDPGLAAAHNNLANIWRDRGQWQKAEASYRQAVTAKPDFPEAYVNLGNLYRDLSAFDKAADAFDAAIRTRPDYADAFNGLASVLKAAGQLPRAEDAARKALELNPRHAEAENNLGVILLARGERSGAVAALRRAIAIDPNVADMHNNLGVALFQSGRPDEAVEAFRRALDCNPSFVEAYSNIGNVYKDHGQVGPALAAYRKAVVPGPNFAAAHSNLIFAMNYDPAVSVQDIWRESRRWNRLHGLPPSTGSARFANQRDPDRRLRIGYVSPDFRVHSVARFLLPLVTAHSSEAVDVYAYAEVDRPDAITATFRQHIKHWRSTVGQPDDAVAARIRDDRIDILVDVAGHSARNRLGVLARRPAPVQVTWLGYPNTTGMDAVDYILVDDIACPEALFGARHSETLWSLPHGFLCFGPPSDAPSVVTPPSAVNGYVTFGSLNNIAKVTPAVAAVWCDILRQLTGSRLILKSKAFAAAATRARFLDLFEHHGIAAQRLVLTDWVAGQAGHLESYNQIDVALDTFPYNGATTTCEALWMGVPVVSLVADRPAGRMGASILTQVGLTTLAADDVQAYVDRAIALAKDAGRLADLRRQLRETVRRSKLCDAADFARAIEDAYRGMWRRWCESTDRPVS